jgi:hypothetical protein
VEALAETQSFWSVLHVSKFDEFMKKTFLIFAFIGLFFGYFAATKAAAQKRSVWRGVWSVPSRFTPSSLTIKPVSAASFGFEIEAMNGANMGEVSGVAKIVGNKAYFDDRQAKNKDERYGCKLTFTHRGAFIDVEMNDKCRSYAGSGVYFTNKYYKGKQKVREDNFVVLEVFPDMALDRKFKTLVGADYEKFLDSFHQIYPEEDSDSFGAKVFSACVRGICPYTAGIIMYDKRGNLWAAVLDDSTEDKIFARYYTNVSGWTEKLPVTIEKWIADKRELNDGNLTVVFKNKQ